jgi:hypothetical protein
MANLKLDGGWKIHTEVNGAFILHIFVSNEDGSSVYSWDAPSRNKGEVSIGFTTEKIENDNIKKRMKELDKN